MTSSKHYMPALNLEWWGEFQASDATRCNGLLKLAKMNAYCLWPINCWAKFVPNFSCSLKVSFNLLLWVTLCQFRQVSSFMKPVIPTYRGNCKFKPECRNLPQVNLDLEILTQDKCVWVFIVDYVQSIDVSISPKVRRIKSRYKLLVPGKWYTAIWWLKKCRKLYFRHLFSFLFSSQKLGIKRLDWV